MDKKELIIKLLKEELETKDYTVTEKRWIEDIILVIEKKINK